MPKYIVERVMPAGKFSLEELRANCQRSREVLYAMGPQIQWIHSYVADDKVYCVYIAPNEEMVRELARRVGFPADKVSEVKSIIDPTTAELTERELEVLRLASQGLRRRDIARTLCVSESTVRHHLEHIYGKIGTSTRVGATLFAMGEGLLD